jgi:type IV pilus assembly protein PilQ
LGSARAGASALVVAAAQLLGCASGAGTAGERAAAADSSAAPAAAPQAPAAQITSLEMREVAPGVRLELQATSPLVWTQYRDAEGRLVLELPNSAPAPDVTDLGALGGVVDSVAVRQVDSGERPLTRLVIATRGETEHELTASGNQLLLALVPVAGDNPVVAAEAPAAPPAPAEPPTPAEPVRSAAPASVVASAPAGTPDAPYVAPSPIGVAATRLDTVEIEAGGGQVRIQGDGDFSYSTFQLADPARFVIDLHGVVNAAPRTTVPGEGAILQRVRVAQFKSQPEPVARVVLDLTDEVVPQLVATGAGLVVTLDHRLAAAQAAALPPATAQYEPPSPASETTTAEVTQTAPPLELAPMPEPTADAAAELAEPSDVAMVEAVQVQDVPAPMEPDAAPEAPPTFASQTLGEEKRYVGAPIRFSLRDADIKEVLRTFAKISGLNMVVSPGVDAQVTVELNDVPWDQALEIILKTNGLGYQLEGNIMRIAPLSALAQEAADEARIRQEQELAIPLRTVLKRISYAAAPEVATLLRSGDQSVLSARGSVAVDERTNTLIIKELPDFMDTVLAVIDQIDAPEPQVMIEARIVETTKRFNRSLGVDWGFDVIADAAHGNTTGLVFPNNISGGGDVNLGTTASSTSQLRLRLGNVLNTFSIEAALDAAEDEGLINILSAPKIVTGNNVNAVIQSGLQVPVQTVSNNTVSVQFINATLRLDVTPHVTADGTILLSIEVLKREAQLALALPGSTNAPIATRQATTQLLVRDGGTAVIGGIYEVTSDRAETRVPGLADIPILGHIFRNRRTSNENEELMIFITARVIKL